jgi:hypothetical protein
MSKVTDNRRRNVQVCAIKANEHASSIESVSSKMSKGERLENSKHEHEHERELMSTPRALKAFRAKWAKGERLEQ